MFLRTESAEATSVTGIYPISTKRSSLSWMRTIIRKRRGIPSGFWSIAWMKRASFLTKQRILQRSPVFPKRWSRNACATCACSSRTGSLPLISASDRNTQSAAAYEHGRNGNDFLYHPGCPCQKRKRRVADHHQRPLDGRLRHRRLLSPYDEGNKGRTVEGILQGKTAASPFSDRCGGAQAHDCQIPDPDGHPRFQTAGIVIGDVSEDAKAPPAWKQWPVHPFLRARPQAHTPRRPQCRGCRTLWRRPCHLFCRRS